MKIRKFKRQAKSFKKTRFQKPAIFRPLKKSIVDTDQILKVCTVIDLQSVNNGTFIRFFAGPDGYIQSTGHPSGDAIAPAHFIPWPSAQFNKMAAAYQQYTVVGLKIEVVPGVVTNSEHLAGVAQQVGRQEAYYLGLYKGQSDFIDGARTYLQADVDLLMAQDRPKMLHGTEKGKMYCKMGYYIDNACNKKYLLTSGGVLNNVREYFAWNVAAGPTYTNKDQVPWIGLVATNFSVSNTAGGSQTWGSIKATVYYVFTNKNI